MNNNIHLVNRRGERIGTIDKLAAHREGRLHEAFSIFIFNVRGELLLQRRATAKYHSGGLWSNTVCSHPAAGEDIALAVTRRLREEMGFSVSVREVFSIVYRSDYANGLTEHEFDHVFFGHYDAEPVPNPEEVMDTKWVAIDILARDVAEHPDAYTTWLAKILVHPRWQRSLARMVGAQRVYILLQSIPRGRVMSYAAIGRRLDLHPRAIARILADNIAQDTYPCYRVVASDGRLSGYNLGLDEKRRRLEADGIRIIGDRVSREYLWEGE